MTDSVLLLRLEIASLIPERGVAPPQDRDDDGSAVESSEFSDFCAEKIIGTS